MKAETGVMSPEAKECQGLPATRQKLGERQRTHAPSQPLEGGNSANTSLLICRLWENQFLLFKPPSLWYFITAASQKTQTIPKGLCGSFRTCPKILDMTANKRWKPFPQTPFSSAQTCDLHLRCQTGWK